MENRNHPRPNPNEISDDATLRMTNGELIFTPDGNPSGVAIADSSLDYTSAKQEEVVIIIRPPQKGEI